MLGNQLLAMPYVLVDAGLGIPANLSDHAVQQLSHVLGGTVAAQASANVHHTVEMTLKLCISDYVRYR